jgi:hypothetical protein
MNGIYHTPPEVKVLSPTLAEIREFPEPPYYMSRADVEQAIENVKSRRAIYASDAVYFRRLNFFENILAALQGAIK